MKHLDLFSGIGGFSLAVDRIWHEEENEHIFVEWDDFCTEVLKKHWPKAEYHKDIRNFVTDTKHNGYVTSTTRHSREKQSEGWSEKQTSIIESQGGDNGTFLLTGGFPCQPFSQAGRRKGTEDDRYLWPAMLECISLFKPRWVIAENVSGLATWNDGMVLETVCADLESEGYEVQPLIIPAVAIGAPHRRDRVWIVAHSNRAKPTGEKSRSITEKSRQATRNGATDSATRELDGTDRQLPKDRQFNGHEQSAPTKPRQQLWEQGSSEGVETSQTIGTTRSEANQREHQYTWADDWREVAFATCHDGVDDGLPRRMDRNPRLKALGNAIVPQVAEEIMKAIKIADRLPTSSK